MVASPTARVHESRNRGLETGMVPHTITPRDPLEKILFTVPSAISSAGLEVLFPEQGALLPGATTNILLNWKF